MAAMNTATTSPEQSDQPDQYDSPWKEAVEHYFAEFMAFYFPKTHTQIDWARGYTFLEQELQAIVRDAELGKRYVDKLVQVHRLSGQEDWIYIHLEVQGTAQAEFAKRMFVYNYRIFDRYDRPVASMAVLADDGADWKPQQWGYEVFDCHMGIQFPAIKLTDYAAQEQALTNDPNPFALVTLAHLQTRATRKDPQARFDAKWKLVKLLYGRGWDKQRIIDLLFVIDWMMALPDTLKKQLWQNIQQLEQEKRMAYVSSFEQIGMEIGMEKGMEIGMGKGIEIGMGKGLTKGLQTGEALSLQRLLTKRFGPLPPSMIATIETANIDAIEVWFDRAIDAPSLSVVFAH